MPSSYVFDERLSDHRSLVSPEHYPDFRLEIYENDGGIGIKLTTSSKDGPREPVLVAISADDAQKVIVALKEAIDLARR